MTLFHHLLGNIAKPLLYSADLIEISFKAFADLFHRDRRGRRIIDTILLKQILFTGVEALPVVLITSALLGIVVIVQAVNLLPKLGAEGFIGQILVVVIIRELGPILTGLIVIGRSGTAIASELGNMKVGGEIEAIESMGIETSRFLVMPRVIGVTISSLCLTIFFDTSAILSGFVVSSLSVDVPISLITERFFESLMVKDIVIGILKGAIFGMIISSVNTYHGLSVRFATTEVPQVTTRGVVNSILLLFMVNGAFTVAYFL